MYETPRPYIDCLMPVPPSSNTLYVHTKNYRRILSKEGRAWRHEAALLLRQSRPLGTYYLTPRYCAVALALNVSYQRDISNCVKLAHDALAYTHLIHDDRYIEIAIEQRRMTDWHQRRMPRGRMHMLVIETPKNPPIQLLTDMLPFPPA